MSAALAAVLCLAPVVVDGDTWYCRGHPVRIRAESYNAPETRGSPACATPARRARAWCDFDKGERARQALIAWTRRGPVWLTLAGRRDFYGRPLGSLHNAHGTAEAMLRAKGLAR